MENRDERRHSTHRNDSRKNCFEPTSLPAAFARNENPYLNGALCFSSGPKTPNNSRLGGFRFQGTTPADTGAWTPCVACFRHRAASEAQAMNADASEEAVVAKIAWLRLHRPPDPVTERSVRALPSSPRQHNACARKAPWCFGLHCFASPNLTCLKP